MTMKNILLKNYIGASTLNMIYPQNTLLLKNLSQKNNSLEFSVTKRLNSYEKSILKQNTYINSNLSVNVNGSPKSILDISALSTRNFANPGRIFRVRTENSIEDDDLAVNGIVDFSFDLDGNPAFLLYRMKSPTPGLNVCNPMYKTSLFGTITIMGTDERGENKTIILNLDEAKSLICGKNNDLSYLLVGKKVSFFWIKRNFKMEKLTADFSVTVLGKFLNRDKIDLRRYT
jgi:hypothetical protein